MSSDYRLRSPAALRRTITDHSSRIGRLTDVTIWSYVLLAMMTLFGAALRLYKLGEWSFWQDEINTVMGVPDSLSRYSLSLVLVRSTVDILGLSEWSARLVPALIGVVTIPLLYFPTRKMFGPGVALVSAVLLAVSPWHLYWSQNARFYTLLLLLYTLALFTFYFGLEEKRPLYLVLSFVFLLLAARERLVALFFVPVVYIYLGLLAFLPFEKPSWLRPRNLALVCLPLVLLGLFMAWPYLRDPRGWMDGGFGRVNNSPFWILGGVVYYVGLSTVSMAVVGALYLVRKKDRAALFLSLGAFVPLLGIMLLAPFHYTANRYVFVSLPSWIILASVAAVEILTQAPRNAKVLALGCLLFLVLNPLSEDLMYFRYQNGNRENWKAAFALVKRQKTEGELVVTPNPVQAKYYLQEKTEGMEGLDLSRLSENERGVWLIEDMTVESVYPTVHRWVEENAHLVANFDVHVYARNFKMRVYYYDPATPPKTAPSRSSQQGG